MSHKCTGNNTSAGLAEVLKLVKDLENNINDKLLTVDIEAIDRIKKAIIGINADLDAIRIGQNVQDNRLDVLESNAANLQFTKQDIIDAYGDVD